MDKQKALRKIPAVDKLLADKRVLEATKGLPRSAVAAGVRAVLADIRGQIIAGSPAADPGKPGMSGLAVLIREAAEAAVSPATVRVINATGVVIHTNLGRAPLAERAVDAVVQASGYSNLEFDLAGGERGSRTAAAELLLTALTGAEAALVVNNNAAAVFLSLAVLAGGREVIISRGELIEIGGSFRIPEIIAAAGCAIREVGTTNRTRVSDYERAVNEKTALLLKVHPSNYQIVGFAASTGLVELAGLGQRLGLPVVEDLGSGSLYDLPSAAEEPRVGASLAAGARLVTFSGDKLLGGPQCGVIAGDPSLIRVLRNHPIYRAVRVDKMTLAALEATLRLYLYDDPSQTVPVLAFLSRPIDQIKKLALKLAAGISSIDLLMAEAVPTRAMVGGGALPGRDLPSWGVKLGHARLGPEELAGRLRLADPPVVGRVEDGALILDMMAVSDAEVDDLATVISTYIGEPSSPI